MTVPVISVGGKKYASVNDVPAAEFRRPATVVATVSPTDNAALPGGIALGFFIGTAGNLSVILIDGVTTVVIPVPAGRLDLMAYGINNTNTTASNIVAIYA